MFPSRPCQQNANLHQWRSILCDCGRLWARLVLTVWLLAVFLPAYAAKLSGTVVGVHDGDTVTVLDAGKIQHKIRLAGIDAPELSQPFGRASRQHLADQVAGHIVVIEWTKRDKYQRLVGKVLLDGRDINITQIEAGLAWHYKRYATEQSSEERQRYAGAEEQARTTRLGLWQNSDPVPPWAYRKIKKP
jgi:endonuclease YncB( thermonuclease family)